MDKTTIDDLIREIRSFLSNPTKEHCRIGDYDVYSQGPVRRPCQLFPPTMRVIRMPGWEGDGDSSKDVYCLQSPDTIMFFPRIEYRPCETIIPILIVATRVKVECQGDLDNAVADCVRYASDPASGELREPEILLDSNQWSQDPSVISRKIVEVVVGSRGHFTICAEVDRKDAPNSRIMANIDYKTYLPLDHLHRPGEFAALLRVLAHGFHQASLLSTPCKICHEFCNGNHGKPWKINCDCPQPHPSPEATDDASRTP